MRIILIVSSLLLLIACGDYTCEDFRTGEYRYTDTAYKEVKITRTLTGEQEFEVRTAKGVEKITKEVGEQTETMTRDGRQVEDVYTIIWDGPCSYTLVFKSTSSQVDQFHTQYDTIRTRILETNRKGYVFQTHLFGQTLQGELEKVD
ncbi:MAG: hypothetical protein HKN79_10865 [Flavobacteriales bacterium]|nr:hypothetical protein [Flavobacteriales bacterium]